MNKANSTEADIEKFRKSYRKNAIEKYGSLRQNNPELAKEWHPTKNGDLTPDDVLVGTNQKVWWLLHYYDTNTQKYFDFEWEASICNRNKGRKCPYLSGKKLYKGFNDIVTTNPYVASHWHPTKNGDLTPDNFTKGSRIRVWWQGKCGHEWQGTIANECTKFTCPICAKEKRTSFPEQAIFYYIYQLFPDAINGALNIIDGRNELDIYIPSIKTAIEYDGQEWHKDTKRDINKDKMCKDKGIILYRIREKECPDYKSYSIKYKYDYTDWNSLNSIISEICFIISNKRINVDIYKDETDIYSFYSRTLKQNSIGVMYPNLLDMWHPTKNGKSNPLMIKSGSNHSFWWKDKLGHEFKCTPNIMKDGKEHCPYCSNKTLLKGFNDIATKYPELMVEWDFQKNNISPNEIVYQNKTDRRKFWWKCRYCGNEWQAPLFYRISLKTVCRHCKKGQSLTDTHPEFASEFISDKNGITPDKIFNIVNRKRKFWWKCNKCGYEWQATINNRRKGGKCPNCSNKLYKKVRCIETGEIFLMIKDASEKYGINPCSITQVCKGIYKNKTAGGYHWEYVEQ